MNKNPKTPALKNTSSNKNRFIEMRALNSMMWTRYSDKNFGGFTIPDFDSLDAASVVYYYCKNFSNRFNSPRIWVSKNSNRAFVVAKVGDEQVMIDPTSLNRNELGEPLKLLKNIYDYPLYGKEFNSYDLDDYMLKYSNLINIDRKQIERAIEELKFLG